MAYARYSSFLECIQQAEAGLEAAHNLFDFYETKNGTPVKLSTAMENIKTTFRTGQMKGTKPFVEQELTVPYKKFDSNHTINLQGEELVKQLQAWAATGTIEPSAADAIKWVSEHPGALDLRNRYFVVFGATSAMGPLQTLLSCGANIIAIDLNLAKVWEGLLQRVKNSCAKIFFPINGVNNMEISANDKDIAEISKQAGCNLMTQTPQIANWLCDLLPDNDFIVGNYTYLDADRHVKLSIASDAIMKRLLKNRKGKVSLAFLCSPTDVFVVPKEAFQASRANKYVTWWQALFGGLLGLVPNYSKTPKVASLPVCNGVVAEQGPSYALAKRLQHWRAMLARSNGSTVSTNIAPSTATQSVVSNKLFALAYKGMKFFKPMEVFYQDLSNAVMGALLIHDVVNPKSVASPATPLEHPQQLFSFGAFHGGIWRGAFRFNKVGPSATVAALFSMYGFLLPGVAGLVWYFF